MFIEKITDEDVDVFAKMFNCSVSLFDKKSHQIYMQLFTGYYGPQPEFWLTDFMCKTDSYYQRDLDKVQKEWRKFLYKKFGLSYKKALANYLNNQTKNSLNEIN